MDSNFDKSEWLFSDCSSENIARYHLALAFHEAAIQIQMCVADEGSYHAVMAHEFGCNGTTQEILKLTFHSPYDDQNIINTAILYDKEDLVIIEKKYYLEDDIDDFIEPIFYKMTISAFFSYFNSLPNIHKHIDAVSTEFGETLKLSLKLSHEFAQ